MRAAGLALVCVVIGGGMAFGYLAADREYLASLRVLEIPGREQEPEANPYPQTNSDGKHDRLAPLRIERAEFEPEPNVLPRGDLLRQTFAAVEPVMTLPQAAAEPPPLPKPRPKAQILLRNQASYTLLSDLQIDAIKSRLKLTAGQQRNWPPVEAALRTLAARLHEMKKSGETPTDLPPDSPELAGLKTAAAPLMAQLNADQKRELRTLAHLIGLAKVAAQL
jgi:hypothetical protein